MRWRQGHFSNASRALRFVSVEMFVYGVQITVVAAFFHSNECRQMIAPRCTLPMLILSPTLQRTDTTSAYWACPQCTLHNKTSDRRCAVCHAQRPRDVVIINPRHTARICWPSCLPRALADETLHKDHVFRLVHPSGVYGDEVLRFDVGTVVRLAKGQPPSEPLGGGRRGRVMFQSVSLPRTHPLIVVKDMSTNEMRVCERNEIQRADSS